MRRRASLSATIFALLLSSAVVSPALGRSAPPRDLLTVKEYAELLATQQAVSRRAQRGTATSIAQRDCRGLTGVSRLTSTQHAECVASLLFFYHFAKFPPALSRCQKRPSVSGQLRCIQHSDSDLYRFTRGFIRTDSASMRAARQRGLTGQCLDYLVLTAPQSKAMYGLLSALRGLTHAIRAGDPTRIASSGNRLSRALTVAGEAFNTPGSVTVCPHQ